MWCERCGCNVTKEYVEEQECPYWECPMERKMTKEERTLRIREIEARYSKQFLANSLHTEAIEWRQLTAPNAASFDTLFSRS